MKYPAKLRFGYGSTPLALLALGLISFGLFIPWLGFYWDDWETILVAKLFPTSEYWSYFPPDRPLAAWTYLIFAPLLGTKPLHWHILTLLLRWATVLAMWWVFARIWPGNRRQVTLAALLFMVYPVFLKQPISVAFHQHWTAYALYFGSVGMMIHAEGSKLRVGLLTAGAVLAMVLHLAVFEYFMGVELLRPLLLWLHPSAAVLDWRKRLASTLKRWSPYLLVLAAFAAWRIAFAVENPSSANPPRLLMEFPNQPLASISTLIALMLEGASKILLTRWAIVFESRFIYPQQRAILLSWAVGALCAIGVVLYRSLLGRSGEEDGALRIWIKQGAFIGLVATLLGSLPYWITGGQVLGGLFGDRFALPSMFGASIAWIAALEWLRTRWRPLGAVVGILIGASTALHLRVANDYRWSWIDQRQFNWHLYWRAPSIAPNTILLAEGDVFGYVKPTFSTNLLYLQPEGNRRLPYWFYSLSGDFQSGLDPLLQSASLRDAARQFQFAASTSHVLVIHSPPTPRCLWILGPGDMDEPALPGAVGPVLHLSDLDRIEAMPTSNDYPAAEIFGPEPEHDWCFYFEKADLAAQFGDWESVADLADEARDLGYHPGNPYSRSAHEWIPFIEAYGQIERWSDAEELTLSASEEDPESALVLCLLWERLGDVAALSERGKVSYQSVMHRLACDT